MVLCCDGCIVNVLLVSQGSLKAVLPCVATWLFKLVTRLKPFTENTMISHLMVVS